MLRGTHIVILGAMLFALPGLAETQYAYFGMDNQWHVVVPQDEPALDPAKKAAGTRMLTATNIDFTVTYMDVVNGSGFGFDDSVEGAARQAILESVLDYVDAVLNESGAADIRVQPSENNGSGPLARASTYFPTGPPGYHDGVSFKHITTGVDPIPGTPDILITVDFAYPFHAGMDAPDSGEVDLYSVMLHEVTHGLGFASLTSATGASQIGTDVRNSYCNFVFTGNDVKQWDSGGVFVGMTDHLTGSDNGLVFTGSEVVDSYGINAPLHAPNPFVNGSSVSHFHASIVGGSVMTPAILVGSTKRTFADVDIAILRDLGYVNAETPPGPTPTPPPAPADPQTIVHFYRCMH